MLSTLSEVTKELLAWALVLLLSLLGLLALYTVLRKRDVLEVNVLGRHVLVVRRVSSDAEGEPLERQENAKTLPNEE